MRRWFVFLCAAALSPAVDACINEIGIDRYGRSFPADDYAGDRLLDNLTAGYARKNWLSRIADIEAKANAEPDLKNSTDRGILRMYQGRYVEAVNEFLAIETRFPGHHETAANLGTALELMGDDAIALRWIRIGIQRNAREHYGTEWLHARILETKIALRRDPHALDGRSVLGVTFQPVVLPPLPTSYPPGNDGKPVGPIGLNLALDYQLHERMGFVKPKDPIVADLLVDWATLNLSGGPIQNADVLYPLAVRYGAPHTPLMKARQKRIGEILSTTAESSIKGVCRICRHYETAPPPPPARK